MRDPHGRGRANDVDALACFRLCTALERRGHGEDGIDATCGALETCLIFEVPCNDRDAAGLECLSSSGEFAYTGDEAVRHSHPYVQRGVDARRDGARHVTA